MNKFFLFLPITFIVFFVSCEEKQTQLEFPVSLFSTGEIIESKVRLFVRDGEILDEKVINDFLGESRNFFYVPIKSNEINVRFLSEKEVVLNGDSRICEIIKENELLKIGHTSTDLPMPQSVYGDVVYKQFPESPYYYYNNLYINQIKKYTTESITSFAPQRYFYPVMIAHGDFEHLYFSFIAYKAVYCARHNSDIQRISMYANLLGNELNDMDELEFRRDDNKWSIQYNDTIAVKEFKVEFKAKHRK